MISVNNEEYLSAKETSKLLCISMESLRRFRINNNIKGYVFSPRKIFYKKSEIIKKLNGENI